MQYICSKTGDEGSIYAVRQGMRACNNNNMCNPSLRLFYYGVTHVTIVACPHPLQLSCCIYTALVPCLVANTLPPSPVSLHIYCPHPLSCCIYTALIPCLAANILHLFLYSVLPLQTYNIAYNCFYKRKTSETTD